MELDNFTKRFANQLMDSDVKKVTPDIEFRQLDTWDSLTGMAVLAMIQDEYGLNLSVEDFITVSTPRELFELIESKIK